MFAAKKTSLLLQIFLLFATSVLAVPTPNVASTHLEKRASSFWMENIQRQGAVAYGNDTSYKIFRNVRDYGAKGDGTTDDTEALNRAISDGNRCGQGCDSSTTTPAIIYFPSGTYRISAPVVMYYYTQMIGDATNLPVIKGLPSFSGLALLDADPYIVNGWGANWYTNQNNFFRQVRNFVIDMTEVPEAGQDGSDMSGIHWQVAQASSLQNVVFNMKPASPTNKQRGIMMENGSGMFMSDVTFNGGNVGAYIGAQQFTTRNFTFNGQNTAIQLIWNWLWTFKDITITNCQVGLNISALSEKGVNQTVGSAVLMDSKIQAQTGIITSYGPNSQPGTGGTFLLQNVDFAGTPNAVVDSTGKTILGGNAKIATWGQGNAYLPPSGSQKLKRDPPVESASIVTPPDTCGSMNPSASTAVVSPLPAYSSTMAPSDSVSPASPPSPSSPSSPSTSSAESSAGSLSPTSASSAASSSPAPYVPVSNGTSPTSSVNGTNAPSASKCTASAVLSKPTKVNQAIMNAPPMPSDLTKDGTAIFGRSKPQYENIPVGSFVSIKSLGAKGDGTTDDSQAIQDAVNKVTTDQILYFDHGAYVITKTIDVPSNIRIVGEIWPLIMINGEFFSDQSKPQPAFRIGKPGDTGNVEISDLIFETKGPAPGAIMMEWNVAQSSQGSAAMWDTHFRVGGTAGTELQQDKCMGKTTDSQTYNAECAGSFMMIHITQTASAYLENNWFWVADHELDLPLHNQTNIYNGRGVFIESQGPVWLMGTSSEHSVFYNYQIANAKNVWMGAIQTETAYMQSAPDAMSSGFTPNAAYSDPDFADCGDNKKCIKTWGLRVVDSQDIYMHGGGLYSFFDNYNQDCLATDDCQLNMIDIECSSNVYLYGMVTKASTNQVVVNGQSAVLDKDNPNLFGATVLLYQQA